MSLLDYSQTDTRPTIASAEPLPLDDGLAPAWTTICARRRRLLWMIGLLALALRLVLLPIGHYWDLTVDYNMFIDLARNHSPYDTMTYLSHVASSAGWDTSYEYYAYPPVPLYIYWPLAHLYAWLHPHATYFIPVSGTHALPSLGLDFFFLFKLPIWIADFVIAGVLARMSGTVRGFRDYLLNPYVLLVSGAWTFDAVMVAGLLLSVYWMQRERVGRSAVALAFGTMVKFIPAAIAPALVLYMIKKQRPIREIALFVGAYIVACVVFLGPFLRGLLYVLSFHSGRVGGGMTWQEYWREWKFFPPGANLDPMSLAIGAFGTITLAIMLLLAYWRCANPEMRLNQMVIVTLAAFLVGSKLVNEQYALVILPFAWLEARQVGGIWRWFYRLFWITPLAFAVMRVPIDRFLWLFYHMLFGARADVITTTGLTGFESPFIPWHNLTLDQVIVTALGIAFFALCVAALVLPARTPLRRALASAHSEPPDESSATRREGTADQDGSGQPVVQPQPTDTTPLPRVVAQH